MASEPEDELRELEEENQQLKRLLVAKLRTENSWLRERLQAGRSGDCD